MANVEPEYGGTRANPDDLVAEPPARVPSATPGTTTKALIGALGLAVIGVLVVWFVGTPPPLPGMEADVPLVTADASPTKRQPEEPGGVPIPDQDKLVYRIIDPETQGELVERLLPPPEEPMLVVPLPQGAPEDLAEIAPAAAAPPEDPAATSALAPLPTAPPSAAEPEVTFAATEAAVAALAQEPTLATGVWRVQIGAFKNREQADDEWTRVVKKAGDVLAGYESHVENVDLGADQGIFHRLQVAGLANRDAADAMCERLGTLGVNCLVVKP